MVASPMATGCGGGGGDGGGGGGYVGGEGSIGGTPSGGAGTSGRPQPPVWAALDGLGGRIRNWLNYTESGQELTAILCVMGCVGMTEESQRQLDEAQARFPMLLLGFKNVPVGRGSVKIGKNFWQVHAEVGGSGQGLVHGQVVRGPAKGLRLPSAMLPRSVRLNAEMQRRIQKALEMIDRLRESGP